MTLGNAVKLTVFPVQRLTIGADGEAFGLMMHNAGRHIGLPAIGPVAPWLGYVD